MSAKERFTPEQIAAIRAYIDSVEDFKILNPQNEDHSFFIATELNKTAQPEFLVWNSQTPFLSVYNQIVWDNFTPNAIARSDQTQLQLLAQIAWNTSIAIQQMNFQNLFLRADYVDATLPEVRKGISDCLSKLPTGQLNFSNNDRTPAIRNAGSIKALEAMRRSASVLEKILTTTQPVAVTVGAQSVSAYEPGYDSKRSGEITTGLVSEIRNG